MIKNLFKFVVLPTMLVAGFFVSVNCVLAAPAEIIAGNTSSGFSNWQLNFSWQHTVATTTENQILLITLHASNDYINSVSYNGQMLTLAAERINSRAYNNLAVYIYYLANPTPGEHDIIVNAKNRVPIFASAITFSNCDINNPLDSVVTFYDVSSNTSHTILAANPGAMIVDAVTFNKPQTTSIAPGSGQTQYFSSYIRGSTNDLYSGESYKLADETEQQTMSWITGDSRPSVHAIVALKPNNSEPDPVILVPGIMGSWNISGRWQIDPIFHTYDNLMEALVADGYRENTIWEDEPTLFTFPYDWRADNNITADLLKEKINLVKEITGKDKVDIIAHSMGGLVTRSYVEGDNYQDDVDRVIFLGTPHKGSLESYTKYEGGVFTEKWDWLFEYIFQAEAVFHGYLDLADYIRAEVLSVEQLLPTFDYLKDKQIDNTWQLRSYPLNYPQNIYLEDLNNTTKIDLLKQRVNITNIISDLGSDSTLNYLRVVPDSDLSDNKWQNGYPENLEENLNSLEMGNGDDTVPLFSSNSINGIEVIESNSSDHLNLPTIMQKEIINVLTGKMPQDYYNSKTVSFIKKWFFFRIYSPVDFMVIAPDGSKIGKDFENNTEINEMPDAFYSGFDSHTEFVLIPNPQDGEYRIELQGTDNGGEYKLASSFINDSEEIIREFSGSIETNQERDFTIDYNQQAEDPIGDLEPEDTIAPTVTINTPQLGQQYLRNQDLLIDYAATDDFSGISTTSIMIDNKEISTSTIDLFNYAIGAHTLTIVATDKRGNINQVEVSFEVIANIASTIADLQEIRRRGWFWGDIYEAILVKSFKLQSDKQKTINKSLDLIVKLLNNAKKQKVINQIGYDIIINDINYLRINL